jgi:preprotein translocase subunit SecD
MLVFTRWKAAAILITALVVCLFALLNFVPESVVQRWPSFAQHHIVLGLDLQGGSSLLLQVDTHAVRQEQLQRIDEDVLRVLREARIPFTGRGIRGNSVQVHITCVADVSTALSRLRELSQPLTGIFAATGERSVDISESGDLATVTPSDDAIAQSVHQAVDQSIEIIQRRVNELGLVEPTIEREGIDRILVEVPGLQNPTQLRDVLGKTAKLEFHMLCSGALSRMLVTLVVLSLTNPPKQHSSHAHIRGNPELRAGSWCRVARVGLCRRRSGDLSATRQNKDHGVVTLT